MVIFPRGYPGPDRWRTICHYKYIEQVELEKGSQIRQKYNLESLIVLAYPSNTVKLCLEVLPEQLVKIKNWKYQENLKQLDEKGKQAVERYRWIFPSSRGISCSARTIFPFPFPS